MIGVTAYELPTRRGGQQEDFQSNGIEVDSIGIVWPPRLLDRVLLLKVPIINKRPLRHYGSTSIWLRLLRDTLVDCRELGWSGLGSYGIYMGQENFLNRPILKERDFGGQ